MSDEDSDGLIPAKRLRARYGGVSHMWIERKLTNDPTFPKPVYIATRRFWRLSSLIAWERKLATQQAPSATAAARAALAARVTVAA